LFPTSYKLGSRIALASLILIGASILSASGKTQAADRQLTVTLPSFPVTLNGQTVDNRNREYPLVVYKDITYFPMTWYDSRYLGLENTWSPDQGLTVQQSNITAAYHGYASAEANTARSYQAELAEGPITVNGQAIDNRTEEYPLLSFRNITYFPLTWRYAHDAFNWEYDWSDSSGLSIRSSNPQVKDAGLPDYAAKNGFAVYKGYYYFAETEGAQNHIYRSPVSSPGDKKHIYAYEYSTSYGNNTLLSFNVRDDALWLNYHMGGATMGSDHYVKLNEDGTVEKELSGYIDFTSTPLGRVIINYGVPPFGNNLYLVPPGQSYPSENMPDMQIGNPSMMYGWSIIPSEEGGTSYGRGSLEVAGTSVYVLGSPYPVTDANRAEANRIWKIDLKNGKQTAVTAGGISRFTLTEDGRILYVKVADGLLYASDLNGQQEMLLSGQHKVSQFSSVEGKVFFTVLVEGWMNRLFRVEDGKEPQEVSGNYFAPVYFTKDRILAQTLGRELSLNIYDSRGEVLLRMEGDLKALSADGKQLLLKLEGEASLKALQF
jgi:hypothetical protein